MSVFFKFAASTEINTVTFDGVHISVADLKQAIVDQKRLGRGTDFQLIVTNSQTDQEYVSDATLIPKNSSLIVKRVPVENGAPVKKFWDPNAPHSNVDPAIVSTLMPPVSETVKAATPSAAAFTGTDLTKLSGSEEDKIKSMMVQSASQYDPSTFVRYRNQHLATPAPRDHKCYRCFNLGHYAQQCPLIAADVKKATGIPRSFMMTVADPKTPGAMLAPDGSLAVHRLDYMTYTDKERGRMSSSGQAPAPPPAVPDSLQCTLCHQLMRYAVTSPCCGNNFCDECFRCALVESDTSQCPHCGESDGSTENIIPNRFVRKRVAKFQKELDEWQAKNGYLPLPIPAAASAAANDTDTNNSNNNNSGPGGGSIISANPDQSGTTTAAPPLAAAPAAANCGVSIPSDITGAAAAAAAEVAAAAAASVAGSIRVKSSQHLLDSPHYALSAGAINSPTHSQSPAAVPSSSPPPSLATTAAAGAGAGLNTSVPPPPIGQHMSPLHNTNSPSALAPTATAAAATAPLHTDNEHHHLQQQQQGMVALNSVNHSDSGAAAAAAATNATAGNSTNGHSVEPSATPATSIQSEPVAVAPSIVASNEIGVSSKSDAAHTTPATASDTASCLGNSATATTTSSSIGSGSKPTNPLLSNPSSATYVCMNSSTTKSGTINNNSSSGGGGGRSPLRQTHALHTALHTAGNTFRRLTQRAGHICALAVT